MQNSTDSFVLFLYHASRENAHLFWDCIYSEDLHTRNFLNDHNMQSDISYLNISYGMLNRISMKMK